MLQTLALDMFMNEEELRKQSIKKAGEQSANVWSGGWMNKQTRKIRFAYFSHAMPAAWQNDERSEITFSSYMMMEYVKFLTGLAEFPLEKVTWSHSKFWNPKVENNFNSRNKFRSFSFNHFSLHLELVEMLKDYFGINEKVVAFCVEKLTNGGFNWIYMLEKFLNFLGTRTLACITLKRFLIRVWRVCGKIKTPFMLRLTIYIF